MNSQLQNIIERILDDVSEHETDSWFLPFIPGLTRAIAIIKKMKIEEKQREQRDHHCNYVKFEKLNAETADKAIDNMQRLKEHEEFMELVEKRKICLEAEVKKYYSGASYAYGSDDRDNFVETVNELLEYIKCHSDLYLHKSDELSSDEEFKIQLFNLYITNENNPDKHAKGHIKDIIPEIMVLFDRGVIEQRYRDAGIAWGKTKEKIIKCLNNLLIADQLK